MTKQEELRAAAAFKLMGDICASVDVREALLEYADALDELAKWKISGYTEGGVLKCAADLKRERDDALDALQVAREALAAVIASRDERCHDREKFVETEKYGSFWSPSASMIDSSVVAQARAALAAMGENNG